MLQVGRKVVLGALVAVSLSAFAGDSGPNAKVNKEKTGASAACTDLDGKPLPCPDQGNVPPPRQVTRPGENRCTDLDGHPLPCPPTLPNEGSVKATVSPSVSLHALPRNLVSDQKGLWTSPARLREKDLPWLMPFTAFTAGVFASDTAIGGHLPKSQSIIDRSRQASDAGVAALVGAGGGLFLWGHLSGNDQRRETGLLSGEAALGSLGVTELLKATTGRRRPLESNGKGDFFQGGDSFPSEHAAAAWSIATVLAHEYPSPVAQLFAYGLAGGVSAARITGRKHFASDVLIGSAIGWYMGRQVYRAHHGETTASDNIGTFYRDAGESTRQPDNMGSPYVPLDTWIYPAFDRLAALGYMQTGFAGLRPWTRMECARLLSEAGDSLTADDASPEARKLYDALAHEFASEVALLQGGQNVSAQVESVYTRFTDISGQPLADSYHFGQTIINDYGRPYQEGANVVTGFSARATAGPLAFYVRGEYQHAPSAASYPLSVRQVIAQVDQNPLQPETPFRAVDHFNLLDSYVTLAALGQEFSFGKQNLWWGPDSGDAMIMSNNAEPFYMFRIARATPFRIPGLSRIFGPFRYDNFFGRLDGHQFPPNPILYGNKVSFKPTPNLEVGFSRTAVFAGQGLTPLTLYTFAHSFFSTTSSTRPGVDLRRSPGVRHASFDFSYRLPGLRKWLTIYSDSVIHDDISPVNSPGKAAINPGLYLSHFPKLPKLSLRGEVVNTDSPVRKSVGGTLIYWETWYHDAYTNNGNLLGSWIGREGKGVQIWSTYWLSPMAMIQVGYRNAKVAKDFIPGGETANDYSAKAKLRLRPNLELETVVQYEAWRVPVLAPDRQSNILGSVQLTFWPQHLGKVVQ